MNAKTVLDPAGLLSRFLMDLGGDDALSTISDGLIGNTIMLDGPFGLQPMLYADYVASGRPLRQIEQFMEEAVLPFYANTHTLASFCGSYSTRMRAEARKTIARLCNADDQYAVLFVGSGATAGLNRLVQLLGASTAQERRAGSVSAIASFLGMRSAKRTRVIIGPYEHHSNILPWRESGAEVIEVGEDPLGGPDRIELHHLLEQTGDYTRTICAFSAASNITGLMTDVTAITRIVKHAGALMIWDYAGGGPYMPITMQPAPDVAIDAIAISPHKFVGGPGASGILVVRRDAVVTRKPVMPGGGTVTFVSPTAHDYIEQLEEREEAGTPNYIADVRAALAFLVKDLIPAKTLNRHYVDLASRAISVWSRVEGLEIVGRTDLPRLPIFSFLVRDDRGRLFNPQLVTRILSDRFGIQARGGCACAGPYAHRLLNIDPAASARLREEILAGETGNKPGFTRLNLSPFMSADKIDFLIETIANLPATLSELSGHYQYNPEQELFEIPSSAYCQHKMAAKLI